MINGHENLEPKLQEGKYVFQEVSKILGEKMGSIFKELAEKRVLKPYLVDIEVTCPQCASEKLKDRYLCPFCGSFKLIRRTLIEHYSCGTVDFLKKFLKNDEYICPKCNKPLKLIGVDYRRLDNVYRCESCKKIFSLPNIIHKCLLCGTIFSYEKAKLKKVFGYILNEDIKHEIIANCVIEAPLVEILKERGYSVNSPGMLRGSSGIDHMFDIVAIRDKVIAIAVASDTKAIGSEHIIEHFAKAFDSQPTYSIIIASPKLNDEAKKLATLYGIKIIEGEVIEEIKEKFKNVIEQI
jgi:rRNA maturation endonuclease Nob1